MEYQYPLVASNRAGDTRIFYDAETFRQFAYDRQNGNVGAHWYDYRDAKQNLRKIYSGDPFWLRYHNGVGNDWIVRDDRGQPVDKAKVAKPIYPKGKWATIWERKDAEAAHAAALGLPIPRTGRDMNRHRWRHNCPCCWTEGAGPDRKSDHAHRYEDRKIKTGALDDL